MSPFGSSGFATIVMAIGLLGIILSFMVPDRKKSMIALGLACLIILTGLIQLADQSITRFKWERRMREIQRDRQADMEDLRQRMKEKAGDMPKPLGETPKKK